MSILSELGSAVRVRRSDIGLTQTDVALLSGLSRATVNQVEKGTIKDLSVIRAARLLEVLGLPPMIVGTPRSDRSRARQEKHGALDIAARTASVSYKRVMSATQLRKVLTEDSLAPELLPHLHVLLDEAPVSLLAGVVEQLHHEAGLERAVLWRRMRELAHRLKSDREIWR